MSFLSHLKGVVNGNNDSFNAIDRECIRRTVRVLRELPPNHNDQDKFDALLRLSLIMVDHANGISRVPSHGN
jgi:hypothetical protein